MKKKKMLSGEAAHYCPRGIIIEIASFGNYARVTAVDEDTGEEVVAICDAREPKQILEQNAINKLVARLRRGPAPSRLPRNPTGAVFKL